MKAHLPLDDSFEDVSCGTRLWMLYKEVGDLADPALSAALRDAPPDVRNAFFATVRLQTSVAEQFTDHDQSPIFLVPGQCIGSVEIVRQLRQGGMSTVYEGRQELSVGQTVTNRPVAVKVLSPIHSNQQQITAEAESLMRLNDHPQIVTLYTVEPIGHGRYAVVLELISSGDGQVCSLEELLEFRRQAEWGQVIDRQDDASHAAARHCSALWPNPLTPTDVVTMMLPVSEAMAFAHTRGVRHRDLKPGNILIRRTGSACDLLVADWGLAKLAERGVYSRMTTGVGTLRYLAPEVLRKTSEHLVDDRVDIYPFGLILSEMLTLRKPRLPDDPPETESKENRRQLRERRDLQILIERCTEEFPGHRVSDFGVISEALRCMIDGRQIKIRSVRRWERAIHFIVTSPVVSTVLCAVFIAILFLGATGYTSLQKKHAIDRAGLENREALETEDRLRAAKSAAELYELAHKSDPDLATLALERFRLARRRTPIMVSQFHSNDEPLKSVRFDTTGKLLIATSATGRKKVWDVHSEEEIDPHSKHHLTGFDVSRAGDRALGFSDGSLAVEQKSAAGQFLTGQIESPVSAVVWHPTEQRLAIIGNGVWQWDLSTKSLKEIVDAQEHRIEHVEFSRLGNKLLTRDTEGLVSVHNLNSTVPEVLAIANHRTEVPLKSHFQSTGWHFAVASGKTELSFVESSSGVVGNVFKRQFPVLAMDISAEHGHVALGGDDWIATFQSPEFRDLPDVIGPEVEATSLTWTADERMIVCVSRDGSICGWNVHAKREEDWVLRLQNLTDATCDPTGTRLASIQKGGIVRIWQLPFPLRHSVSLAPDSKVSLTADGESIVFAGRGIRTTSPNYVQTFRLDVDLSLPRIPTLGTVREVLLPPQSSIPDPALVLTEAPHQLQFIYGQDGDTKTDAAAVSAIALPSAPLGAALSPDSKLAVVCLQNGQVQFIDVTSRRVTTEHDPTTPPFPWLGDSPEKWVCFSPDGAMCATWGMSDIITIWDARSRSPLFTLKHASPCFDACFSPDSLSFASAHAGTPAATSCDAVVWDCNSGQILWQFPHRDWVYSVEFSKDGRHLLTASRDRSARLWRLDNGILSHELVHSDGVRDATFAVRDPRKYPGRRDLISTVTNRHQLDLWDAQSCERGAQSIFLNGAPRTVEYSKRHDSLLVTTDQNRLEVFRLGSPDDVLEPEIRSARLLPYVRALDGSAEESFKKLPDATAVTNSHNSIQTISAYLIRLASPENHKQLHEQLFRNATQEEQHEVAKLHKQLTEPQSNLQPTSVPGTRLVDFTLFYTRAEAAVARGDHEVALENLAEIFKAKMEEAHHFALRSEILFRQQKFRECYQDTSTAIDMGLSDWKLKLRKAQCLSYMKRWKEAILVLNGLEIERYEISEIQLERAEVYGYAGHWSQCREDYKLLALKFKAEVEGRYGSAIASASIDPGEFAAECREFYVATEYQMTSQNLLNAAVLWATCPHLKSHEYERMLNRFSRGWTQDNYYKHFVCGAIQYRIGNTKMAVANLETAVQKSGTDGTPQSLAFLAMSLELESRHDEAIVMLHRAKQSFDALRGNLPRGFAGKNPATVRIGDIHTWPLYRSAELTIEEAEKLVAASKVKLDGTQ